MQPDLSGIHQREEVLTQCGSHECSPNGEDPEQNDDGRAAQLEEGYGVPLEPLEQLARSAYGNDPAACFVPKGEGGGVRDTLLLARMQKAVAIMQFKLEGRLIERHPEWHLDDRRLLHTVEGDTVAIDGKRYKLKDSSFPTLDPRDPYALSPAEAQHCRSPAAGR